MPTTDHTPSNVIAALAAVTAEMGGIAKAKPKREPGEQGLSYAYRGIDQIAAAAQPLLGRHGVVIVPTEGKTISTDTFTINNKPWADTTVTVLWTIYGPGGVTDQVTSITQGVGRDNSDKGYNKAMTGAYKNLLLRLLCIGDPNDDGDSPGNQGHQADAPVWRDPNPANDPARPASDGRAAPEMVESKRIMTALHEVGEAGSGQKFRAHLVEEVGPNHPALNFPTLAADDVWRVAVSRALESFGFVGQGPPVPSDNAAPPEQPEHVTPGLSIDKALDALPPRLLQWVVANAANGKPPCGNVRRPRKTEEPGVRELIDQATEWVPWHSEITARVEALTPGSLAQLDIDVADATLGASVWWTAETDRAMVLELIEVAEIRDLSASAVDAGEMEQAIGAVNDAGDSGSSDLFGDGDAGIDGLSSNGL